LARRQVEEARERVAASLGARPSEVVFTGGGTESDNLAVKGIYWSRSSTDPKRNRVIASAAEHHAVLDAVQWLGESEGAVVTWLAVDALGRVSVDALREELDRHGDEVAVITAMWANNEVGTVQPVAELAALAAERGIPFHTDAIQAIGQVPVDFARSDAAALTTTGHKLGGPTGVGALLLGRDVACTPLLHGGGQERDVRSGTLDVAGIVSFAVAVEAAIKGQSEFATRVVALRDELVAQVRASVPDAILNGDPTDRLPGNAHFSFPGCEGDALLLLLDAAGIACSTGSACSAGIAQPSHVLLAMGADDVAAKSTLRFSLGHTSTAQDVAELAAALPGVVDRARRAGAVRKPSSS
jgi:cysteine desulfurase